MKIINRLIILTIVFSFIILIGAGHGLGFLGIIEIVGFQEFFQGDTKFSLNGNYDDRLFSSATIALVGQILLTIAYSLKQKIQKFIAIYIGLIILLFSFTVLTKNFLNSSLDTFSFWGGTPFVVFAIMLLIRTIISHRLTLAK